MEREAVDVVKGKLNMISKANINQLKLLVKKDQSLEESWRKLVADPDQVASGLVGMISSLADSPELPIEVDYIRGFVTAKVRELLGPSFRTKETGDHSADDETPAVPGARAMAIGDKRWEFRNSFEILVNTGNWLADQGKLSRTNCPVVIGRSKRYLVNTSKKHLNGDPFRAPKRLSNDLWIETSFSEPGALSNARRLLEYFKCSPSLLQVT